MTGQKKNHLIQSIDDRRNIVVPGNKEETLLFCVNHFITTANASISTKGAFNVALSGGSTPKALYQLLASPRYRDAVDWKKVHLFWSDERCVPPTSEESNYHMSMEAGFGSLHIPSANIHRMEADKTDLEAAAKEYEIVIRQTVPDQAFDLIMLGMGDDGHTASLFPKTHGLHAQSRLVIANFLPEKGIWRMTFTFDLLNRAHQTIVYVLGASKATMLNNVLNGPYLPDEYPVQKVGTRTHKTLWVADTDAAKKPTFQHEAI